MNEVAYLNELAADIAANGGLDGRNFEAALAAAHARRQAFALELATRATKRAQMARKALQATVWHGAQVLAANERLSMQARDCVRTTLLACESIDLE
ncbi:hypothetical protein LJR129_005075 [Acidovorax sp. LjRoot129]|uniref:hypothetical protein n=1 Tax=unclassified Acidovorax TaxID=2684926 RepID=UPI003ED0F57F